MLDLAIVGAGPAGMAAAVEATARGLRVLVLDENAAPGGRIWQALETRGAKDADDAAGLALIRAFRACGADARYGATVWSVGADNTVCWSAGGGAHAAAARRVLVAAGTTERPLPIPGWTLPGVMTVGAAQIALKTSGLLPDGATWIAGQGPLLLLYAAQVLRAGGRLAGILEVGQRKTIASMAGLPGAWRGWDQLSQGLAWRREIARAGVPWLWVNDVRAEGGDALARITFRRLGRTESRQADLLLLHDGVIPSVQMTRALDCAHVWDRAQHCWRPAADAWGATSRPGIVVAGDGAGVAGAAAAALSGRIAALGVAHALGRIDAAARDAAAAPLRAARTRHLAVRPLLDALYVPLPVTPHDDTILCRCEEVTAGDVRRAARLGCLGLNQLKAFTRAGMGPCQGRMCALAVAAVLADARRVDVVAIEPYRLRFPIKPVPLGEIADLQTEGVRA